MASALLLGICNNPSNNIFNVKAVSSIKVEVVTSTAGLDGLVASCEGGLTVAGALLGDKPVLVGVNAGNGSVVRLEGGMVIVAGRSPKELIQEVESVQEVRSEGGNVCVF